MPRSAGSRSEIPPIGWRGRVSAAGSGRRRTCWASLLLGRAGTGSTRGMGCRRASTDRPRDTMRARSDAINAEGVRTRSRHTLARVLRDWDNVHGELIRTLRTMTDARWENPATPRGKKSLGHRIGQLLIGREPFEHANAHVNELESFVGIDPGGRTVGSLDAATRARRPACRMRAAASTGRASSPTHATHPALTLRPIDDGSLVPWIASWFPPDHPAGRRGWMPLIPNANEPRALPAPNGTRSVTKYSPTGVGEYEAPVAPGARNTTLPNLPNDQHVLRQVDLDLHAGRVARKTLDPDPALAPGPRVRELDESPSPVGRHGPRPTRRSGCRSTSTRPGRPRPEPRSLEDGRRRGGREARGRARSSSGRRARPRTRCGPGPGGYRTPEERSRADGGSRRSRGRTHRRNRRRRLPAPRPCSPPSA